MAADESIVDRSRLHFRDWSSEVKLLPLPIHFDECSHHSPQKELSVGPTLLGGPGVQIRTLTYYGTCEKYEIFDFASGTFTVRSIQGSDCIAAMSGPAELTLLRSADQGFATELGNFVATLERLYEGYACYPAHPELENTLSYLSYVRTLTPGAGSP